MSNMQIIFLQLLFDHITSICKTYLKKLWSILLTKKIKNISLIDKAEEVSLRREGDFDWWMKYRHSIKKDVSFTIRIIYILILFCYT